MYFHARRATSGPWSVVHVTGEIDLATAPAFRSELVAAGRDGRDVAVDLTDCDFIDSVGIGLLLGGSRRATECGHRLVVVPSERVRDLMHRCRVDEVLYSVESLDALPDGSQADASQADASQTGVPDTTGQVVQR